MSIQLRTLAVFTIALLVSSQTGCLTLSALLGQKRSPTLDTSLLEKQGYQIPRGGMPSPVGPNESGKPRVVVEIRDDKTHIESVPLPVDQAMFVEDLVQQAKLHEHFGRLNIAIMRPNGDAPQIRLDVKTDDDGKAANIGQNYALLPGDHLIVHVDQRSSLERLFMEQFTN